MTARSRSLLLRLLVLAIVLTAPIGLSCRKVPLLAPTESTLTLLVSSSVDDGLADITAVVIESGGTPVHDGTLVVFSTTLGRLDPVEAETTRGRATVRLFDDGRSGTATITAFSGEATGMVEVDIED